MNDCRIKGHLNGWGVFITPHLNTGLECMFNEPALQDQGMEATRASGSQLTAPSLSRAFAKHKEPRQRAT